MSEEREALLRRWSHLAPGECEIWHDSPPHIELELKVTIPSRWRPVTVLTASNECMADLLSALIAAIRARGWNYDLKSDTGSSQQIAYVYNYISYPSTEDTANDAEPCDALLSAYVQALESLAGDSGGMSAKFKTLRHIETVRNYLNLCVVELLHRAERHDQSKLESPEAEMFDEWTEKLRGSTYNSPEYLEFRRQLKPVLDHHYAHNRHHPEHFKDGIKDMTLIDLVEMLMDWKASSMRHNDGNILKSIASNQERFEYSDELRRIFENTAKWIDSRSVFHRADES